MIPNHLLRHGRPVEYSLASLPLLNHAPGIPFRIPAGPQELLIQSESLLRRLTKTRLQLVDMILHFGHRLRSSWHRRRRLRHRRGLQGLSGRELQGLRDVHRARLWPQLSRPQAHEANAEGGEEEPPEAGGALGVHREALRPIGLLPCLLN